MMPILSSLTRSTSQRGAVVPISPPFNWDANTHPPVIKSFYDLFENRKVVMSVTSLPDPQDSESVSVAEETNKWAQDYINDSSLEGEPINDINFPISTESLLSVTQSNSKSLGSVVGILSASVIGVRCFEILPDGTGGIVPVAVFTIGDHIFSYAVNGKNAIFLGRGDLHSSRYDNMERKVHFLHTKNSTLGNQLYTGLPLSDATSKATMAIYPSEEMEETIVTNNSIIYTVVAVLTFASRLCSL